MVKKWTEREFPEDVYRLGRSTLAGVEYAHKILNKAKTEKRKVLIYIDPDTDGMISALFFAKYMEKHGLPYTWYVNPDRKHGFFLKPEDLKGMLMVNGDFQITRDQMVELVANDVDVLSLDHHEMPEGEDLLLIETERNIGIYINNQYDFEDPSNFFQSGAGVTAEVLAEVDPELYHNKLTHALVGITLLSDIRDIENPRARKFLRQTYTAKYTGYVQHLIDGAMGVDYGYGVPHLDRNFIDFKLSPRINSMLRLGKEVEAVEFVMGGSKPTVDYAAIQRNIVAVMVEEAKMHEGDNLIFAEFNIPDIMAKLGHPDVNLSNFVGLCCSRLTDKGKSVIGYTVDYDGSTDRASFRGRVNTADYRSRMSKIIDGRGHGVAFGVIGFKPTGKSFRALDAIAGEAEEGIDTDAKYVDVPNLARFFGGKEGETLARENGFKLGPNRVHVRYTGKTLSVSRDAPKITIYKINQWEVRSFNKALDPKVDLIEPYLSRGKVELTLSRAFEG